MKLLLPLPMAALTALVLGCGGGTVVDPEAAEEDIRAGFAERNVTVDSIDCPSDVETGKGETYECVAETARGTFRVIYRQLDAEGSVSAPHLERVNGGTGVP